MKKKVISFIFVIALFGTGVEVYASSVLNTNIIGLIQDVIQNKTKPVEQDVKDSLSNIDYTDEINSYIDDKNTELSQEMDSFKQDELSRANTEINNYLEEIKSEIDSIYQNESDKAKEKITNDVNEKINDQKDKMLKELEKKLSK